MATMRVTEALDERDLLAKKINKALRTLNVATACREKDTQISGKNIEEIIDNAVSDYQSIKDMIDRYNKINTAITLSNAQSIIKFKDGTEMTRAAAIAIRKQRLEGSDFTKKLLERIRSNRDEANISFDRINRDYERQVAATTQSMVESSKDKKNSSALDEQQRDAIETFTAPYKPKMIDPIDVEKEIKALDEKVDAFAAEIDTLIKISNVDTTIEIDD